MILVEKSTWSIMFPIFTNKLKYFIKYQFCFILGLNLATQQITEKSSLCLLNVISKTAMESSELTLSEHLKYYLEFVFNSFHLPIIVLSA